MASALIVLIASGRAWRSRSSSARWPAFREFGFGFTLLISDAWSPPQARNSARPTAIYGTLVTSDHRHADRRSGGARHRGVPHRACARPPCGVRSASPLSSSLAFPRSSTASGASITFKPGDAGLYPEPFLIAYAREHPRIIGYLFAGPPLGYGVLTAGLVLALMVLPFITAVSRDVFDTVPPVLKEAAYGLGMHDLRGRWQHRHSLYEGRRDRRRYAGARTGAWRDDGGDFCHRQRDQNSRPPSWRRARRSPP